MGASAQTPESLARTFTASLMEMLFAMPSWLQPVHIVIWHQLSS